MKITREFKTGVVFIAALALFIWGFNFLKGKNLFSGNIDTYFAEYKNVQGLNTASIVTINGFQVGKVQNITPNPDPNKRGELIVEFSNESGFTFSKNSIVKIYSDGLMGGKALAIIPSYEGEESKPGDYFKGEIESDIFSSVGEKLNPLQAKIESMIVEADSLLVGLNDVMNETTRNNLKNSVSQLHQATQNFNDISKNVDAIVDENKNAISNSIQNIDKTTNELGELTQNLSSELEKAQIAATVNELQNTIDNLNVVVQKIESGEGSLGKLINDKALYNNLTNASKELEELLREVKEHPKRFVHFSVFGKKDKEGYIEEETQ